MGYQLKICFFSRSENYHKFNVFTTQKFESYSPLRGNNFSAMSANDFVIGGFFGGTVFSVKWFAGTFYALHDEYLANKTLFVGKDQVLYNWIAVRHPDKFLVVCSCLEAESNCGSEWWYFQRWYGSRSEVGDRCRSSPVKSMTDFLLDV